MKKQRFPGRTITRRTFLAAAGMTACASVGPAAFSRITSAQTLPRRPENSPVLLHAAVSSPSGQASIQTFALDSDRCSLVASTVCASFTALAMHPSLPLLYAAADALHNQPLPYGHIEAFEIDRHSGHLTSLARVPMSLAATGPRSLAVSPDGAWLLVSAHTGGIWNAFPLAANGLPTPNPIARKELGAGASHPAQAAAHPHSLLYPANAHFAIATDTGSNSISLIEPSTQGITVHARCRAAHSAGPAHAAFCADQRSMLIANVLAPSLSLWQITGSGAAPSLRHDSTTPTSTPITALLTNPVLPIAYSVRPETHGSRLETWDLADDTNLGQKPVSLSGVKNPLSCIHTSALPFLAASALCHYNGQLWAATSEGILQLNMDPQGRLQAAFLSARLPGLVTLALQPHGVS